MDNSEISIFGLDDILLGKPKIEKTLQHARQNTYNIVLVHEPDIAPQISKYPINLQLSGHSHGGQVQIPFRGYYYTITRQRLYWRLLYDAGFNSLCQSRPRKNTCPISFHVKTWNHNFHTPTFVIIRLFSYISFLVRAHPCFVYHMIKVSPIKEVCSCIHIINQFQSVQHLLVQ